MARVLSNFVKPHPHPVRGSSKHQIGRRRHLAAGSWRMRGATRPERRLNQALVFDVPEKRERRRGSRSDLKIEPPQAFWAFQSDERLADTGQLSADKFRWPSNHWGSRTGAIRQASGIGWNWLRPEFPSEIASPNTTTFRAMEMQVSDGDKDMLNDTTRWLSGAAYREVNCWTLARRGCRHPRLQAPMGWRKARRLRCCSAGLALFKAGCRAPRPPARAAQTTHAKYPPWKLVQADLADCNRRRGQGSNGEMTRARS